MSNLSCGTHVAEPSANKDCRKLLNQFCRFLPKLKLPISADAKLPLTTMRCVLLPGGVFRGTAIRDFEAESVGDVNLSTDKRGDMLCLSGVLHTSY